MKRDVSARIVLSVTEPAHLVFAIAVAEQHLPATESFTATLDGAPVEVEEIAPSFHHHDRAELPEFEERGLWARLIVGSAFVRRVLDAADPQAAVAAVGDFAGELAAAVRRPTD